MVRRVALRTGLLLIALAVLGAPALQAAEGRRASQSLDEHVTAVEASYDRTRLEVVIDELSRLAAGDPRTPEYPYLLARATFPQIDLFDWKGDRERARAAGRKGIEYLEASLQLGGGANPDVYRVLGDYYGRLRFLEGAFGRLRHGGRSARYHKMALDRMPEDPRALIGYATDKLHAPAAFGGDLGAAIELLQKALSIEPSLARGHVWLAKAYLKQGRPVLARAEFDQARALAPKSGFVQSEWDIAIREHDELKETKAALAR